MLCLTTAVLSFASLLSTGTGNVRSFELWRPHQQQRSPWKPETTQILRLGHRLGFRSARLSRHWLLFVLPRHVFTASGQHPRRRQPFQYFHGVFLCGDYRCPCCTLYRPISRSWLTEKNNARRYRHRNRLVPDAGPCLQPAAILLCGQCLHGLGHGHDGRSRLAPLGNELV